MKTHIRTLLLITAVAVLALTQAATAHHSFSAFDTQTEKTATGVVKTVQWSNPHIWIWIDVPNDKGVMETFAFEGMSPNYLERRGWTRGTLKVGDKITVTYNPMRDGAHGGMFRTGRMDNGKVLTMGGSAGEP